MKSLKKIVLLVISIGVIILLLFRKPISSSHNISNETATRIEEPTTVAPEKMTSNAIDFETNGSPQLSQLPILVIGTLVHSDVNQSITALYIKKTKQSDIYVNKSFLSDRIQISKIERGVVYFKNLKTSRLEFLKLNENELDPYRKEIQASLDVQQTAKNSFALKRNTLDKYINDLSKTLLTASVIPHKNSLGKLTDFNL